MPKLVPREWETTYSVVLVSSTATADSTTKKVETLSTVLVKYSTNTLVTEAQTHWTLLRGADGEISSAMEVIRPGEAFASDASLIVGPPVSFSPTSTTLSSKTSQEDHASPAGTIPSQQTFFSPSTTETTRNSSSSTSQYDKDTTSAPNIRPTDSTAPHTSDAQPNKQHQSYKFDVAIALPMTIFLLVVCGLGFVWYKNRRCRRPASQGDFNATPLEQGEKRKTWSQSSFSTDVNRPSSTSAPEQATTPEMST